MLSERCEQRGRKLVLADVTAFDVPVVRILSVVVTRVKRRMEYLSYLSYLLRIAFALGLSMRSARTTRHLKTRSETKPKPSPFSEPYCLELTVQRTFCAGPGCPPCRHIHHERTRFFCEGSGHCRGLCQPWGLSCRCCSIAILNQWAG